MILVDTSVWVDHFRAGDDRLIRLLERTAVTMHPFVVGELACGNFVDRKRTLELLRQLPAAVVAEHDEVLEFILQQRIFGKGIGFVDAHLLASVALSDDQLWTRDKRLHSAASLFDCAF